ncbi:MAG: hypothetical protein ACD_58C00048G0003 [uncultured bacterium]|nr:MAG: hypothetical protein ACD_58C00048G0003 [uncultured bacterium]
MATKLTKKNNKPVKPVKTTKEKGSLNKPSVFTRGLGRRKTSVARVRLFEGKQEITVNDKPISKYWSNENLKSMYLQPLVLTDTLNKYSVSARIIGGGEKSQIGAFVHGIARALDTLDRDKYHTILKHANLLRRDPRMKETRKVGRAGKARLRKQSPKR